MEWRVQALKETVRSDLGTLPTDMPARLIKIRMLFRQVGSQQTPRSEIDLALRLAQELK